MPTIVYDDSAAAEFWEPVPEGMTPAEFQPNVLTREEVTKYVELPNPNPDDWNIPEEGITPEYIERVYQYLQTLRTGLVRAGVAIGPDDPRVQESAKSVYAWTNIVDAFLSTIASAAEMSARNEGEWNQTTDVAVVDFQHLILTDGEVPCVFARVTFNEITASNSFPRDQWVALLRDTPPNWLNPTGWRQATTTPGNTDDLSDFSCEAWEVDK